MKKAVSRMLLLLLSIGTLTSTFRSTQVRAENHLLLEMSVSKTIVNIGEKISIKLTMDNVGMDPVTLTFTLPLFDVYYCTPEGCFRWSDGMYFIQVVLQITLEPGENHSETLQWNLYQFRNGVSNPPKPGTYDMFGLCYPAGIVTQYSVAVTLVIWNPCDINFDLRVDMIDAGTAGRAFGTQPGDTRWNPQADVTGTEYLVPDGKVNMMDIGLIARDFGKRQS